MSLARPPSSHASLLERIRSNIHSYWPEWLTLCAFSALVAFAIPYHEPFADEAQAWQLARSLSLPVLFHSYLRYEASPGLWHFLLWILVHAHVTYTGMHWVCGGIAVGGASLLIFKSPFPRYIKLLLPFTCFLLFQFAIVARSYALVPILLFSIALCWKKNPALPLLLLGLLANTSLHAAVFSGGLAIVYLVEQLRKDRPEWARRRQILIGVIALLALWAFAIWTAWPPKDNAFFGSYTHGNQRFLFSALRSLFWGTCEPWILSFPYWIAIASLFAARRRLLYLLPVVFFAGFSGFSLANWWHVGLLTPLVITLLWITWPASFDKPSRREFIGRIAVVVMAIMQIFWSVNAIRFDHDNAYSPDLATAEFLRPLVQRGARVAVTYSDDPEGRGYRSVGILPYFDHNIFINLPDFFWSWSTRNPTEEMFLKTLPSGPSVVVVEVRSMHPEIPVNMLDPKIQLLDRSGYRFSHMFCGAMPMGFQIGEKNCHLIFQRVAGQQPTRK
jgi:hypothetical protein